ncbi:MAG: transcriptional regulator, partial [Hyphomicrobiales bacterium]|nr:transcriptional regulator [Hyphomicrobiales bacterium]
PEARYRGAGGVTPRLQRVLDALDPAPAIVRTATWDIAAWNRAAASTFTNYAALPPHERNVLRFMFLHPHVRAAQDDWAGVARLVVGSFRAETARAGANAEALRLVEELSLRSPEFKAMWDDNDVGGTFDGVKRIRHRALGPIAFEYSSFAVDGRPDLAMVVYNPVEAADAARIAALCDAVAVAPERAIME